MGYFKTKSKGIVLLNPSSILRKRHTPQENASKTTKNREQYKQILQKTPVQSCRRIYETIKPSSRLAPVEELCENWIESIEKHVSPAFNYYRPTVFYQKEETDEVILDMAVIVAKMEKDKKTRDIKLDEIHKFTDPELQTDNTVRRLHIHTLQKNPLKMQEAESNMSTLLSKFPRTVHVDLTPMFEKCDPFVQKLINYKGDELQTLTIRYASVLLSSFRDFKGALCFYNSFIFLDSLENMSINAEVITFINCDFHNTFTEADQTDYTVRNFPLLKMISINGTVLTAVNFRGLLSLPSSIHLNDINPFRSNQFRRQLRPSYDLLVLQNITDLDLLGIPGVVKRIIVNKRQCEPNPISVLQKTVTRLFEGLLVTENVTSDDFNIQTIHADKTLWNTACLQFVLVDSKAKPKNSAGTKDTCVHFIVDQNQPVPDLIYLYKPRGKFVGDEDGNASPVAYSAMNMPSLGDLTEKLMHKNSVVSLFNKFDGSGWLPDITQKKMKFDFEMDPDRQFIKCISKDPTEKGLLSDLKRIEQEQYELFAKYPIHFVQNIPIHVVFKDQ